MQFLGDGIHQPTNWKRRDRIGRGAHGVVFEAIKDDAPIAVKEVSMYEEANSEKSVALYNEINILKCLRHDRIVRYFGHCTSNKDLFLFMEYIPGGSLEVYFKTNSPLQIQFIRDITKQTLQGVAYLHDNRMIHRDIKAANILMEERFQIKLADFGVSKMFQELSRTATFIGTTRWMAPEMFTASTYSYEVDIWAVGCTVIQMLTGSPPFPDKEEQQVTFHLIKQDLSPLYSLKNINSKETMDFLRSILKNDPKERPKAKTLLENSPFVTVRHTSQQIIHYQHSSQIEEEPPNERKKHKRMARIIEEDELNYYTVLEDCSENQDKNLHIAEAQQHLVDVPWFHGVVPRKEIIRLLTNDGDFLVRQSKSFDTKETQFVLSVYWGSLRHFIIAFYLHLNGWGLEGKHYPTIQELVTDMVESSAFVTLKSRAILRRPIHREWELLHDEVVIFYEILRGSFGEVFKGMYKKTCHVTVKTCTDRNTEDEIIEFLRQGRLLKQFNHPNIVSFIGIAAQKHPIMIVTEFMPSGTLLLFLKTIGKQLSIIKLGQMCADVACAMEYLEENKIIHRDLAAKSCLVGANNTVKLSEFRLCRKGLLYTDSKINSMEVSINWAAPESLKFGKYTSLSDVWSFGALVWEVFSIGETPYSSETKEGIIASIEKGHRLHSPPGTPEQIYSVVLSCWGYDEERRPHFKIIHRMLQDFISQT
ncbi:unnamed protein product [Lymnaea stagnalis]|uniref:Tyrosine-protein kinase n=1 Tax=Lymnaea stagnalis TaxID=6523 RepID=A0AAV2I6M2_LYMST